MANGLDPDVLTRALLQSAHDTYVDPRCSECRAPVNPRGRMGPFLCVTCERTAEADHRWRYADFLSQERPRNRRVHVVKLPEGMVRSGER